MKLIYLTIEGQAKLENVRINQRMIEMPDGYHPVTNDSVWQDGRRLRAPILILVQGVLGPYGASMAEEDTLNVLYEIDVAEKAFKPQSVSKMWQRALGRAIAWVMKYGIITAVALFVMYYVLQAMFGGGP